MTCLPFLLLCLRGLSQEADVHVLRLSPKQSKELADFIAANLAKEPQR